MRRTIATGARSAANDEADLTAEDREEAKKNDEAARVWISGIEAFERKLGIDAIYDLSATPFFLRGSGYRENLLFPWVVSDFSLMDAIESGIVKVPRIPVLDDAIQGELPKFRDIYNYIRKDNPRALPAKGRGKQAKSAMDPQNLPPCSARPSARSTRTMRRFTACGKTNRSSAARRCSSSSATTRRHPSSFMTGFRATTSLKARATTSRRAR